MSIADLVFVLAAGAAAQSQAPKSPPSETKTGDYTTTFSERHPLSPLAEATRRLPHLKGPDYKLSEESFSLSVPASYKPERPYGLLVFIDAEGKGHCRENFKGLLEKHRLIWVGANRAGNDRITAGRVGLALDAVHNVKKLYNIDPERVYASGISGGGRVCSYLTPAFPDVFNGGMYLVGCNPLSVKLPPDLQNRMKQVNGYVLVTGDTDFNLPGTKEVFEEYQRAKFARVTYLQVPGMGHDFPPEAWLEKGLVYLDEPLVAAAKKLYTQALEFQKREKPGKALKAFQKAAARASVQPFGKDASEQAAALEQKRDALLASAQELVEAGKGAEAAPLLEKLLRDYEDASGNAREMLKKARK